MRYGILAIVTLFVLVACSPPGGGPATPVTANVTGYWVSTLSTNFYKLNQSGTEVTGQWYVTLNRQSLAVADYVYECGILGGRIDGRTLTLEIIMTPRNCPTVVDAGEEAVATIVGQVKGDSFSGDVTLVTTITVGGVERQETEFYSTDLENVPASDDRVQFEID